MKKLLQIGFLVCAVSGAIFTWSKQFIFEYPERSELHPEVLRAPLQTDTNQADFTFEYHGNEYFVEPVQEYDIAGIIVSHNNISSITDAYHTSKSVDFRDLCVVWGQNAKKDLLEQMSFWSEPWTCWTKANTEDAYYRFFDDELSNNHLLADRSTVRDTINSARIGDQIRLKGFLVNYGLKNNRQYERKSSLTRTDTGNGACETVFVEQAEILRVSSPFWRGIHDTAWSVCFYLFFVLPSLWIWNIQSEYAKGKKDLDNRTRRSPHLRYKG